MNIADVFGVPVGIHILTTLNCEETIKYIEKQDIINKDNPEGEYSDNQQLLEDDFFKEVKQEVRETTLKFAQEAAGHSVQDLGISTSWANITDDNKHIRKHAHSNSYISGCFYLNQGSNINLHNPFETNDLYMLAPGVKFDANNRFTWDFTSFTPQPNMLLIFPSRLAHSVDASPTRRYSIAYNTMPLGLIGGETTNLNIKEV